VKKGPQAPVPSLSPTLHHYSKDDTQYLEHVAFLLHLEPCMLNIREATKSRMGRCDSSQLPSSAKPPTWSFQTSMLFFFELCVTRSSPIQNRPLEASRDNIFSLIIPIFSSPTARANLTPSRVDEEKCLADQYYSQHHASKAAAAATTARVDATTNVTQA
jgi:hypothetical protein